MLKEAIGILKMELRSLEAKNPATTAELANLQKRAEGLKSTIVFLKVAERVDKAAALDYVTWIPTGRLRRSGLQELIESLPGVN